LIDLRGKRALVTGASRGIGRACALRLAQCGADVAVNFLTSPGPANDVAQQIQSLGRRAVAVRADVSDRDDVVAMVDAVAEQLGGLDIIISNVAAGGFRTTAELTPAALDATFRSNAAPVVWLVQAAVRLLAASQSHGKLIAVSSHGSMWAVPHYAAIGASKAALESLIRHLALEHGDKGINFNCVLPGIVATDAVATMPGLDAVLAAAQQRAMVGSRRLQPEDVANVVAFLASPLSDLIQAQTVIVDAGVCVRA
jgi:enoyl-[acyl-carrier protein] reductase III